MSSTAAGPGDLGAEAAELLQPEQPTRRRPPSSHSPLAQRAGAGEEQQPGQRPEHEDRRGEEQVAGQRQQLPPARRARRGQPTKPLMYGSSAS